MCTEQQKIHIWELMWTMRSHNMLQDHQDYRSEPHRVLQCWALLMKGMKCATRNMRKFHNKRYKTWARSAHISQWQRDQEQEQSHQKAQPRSKSVYLSSSTVIINTARLYTQQLADETESVHDITNINMCASLPHVYTEQQKIHIWELMWTMRSHNKLQDHQDYLSEPHRVLQCWSLLMKGMKCVTRNVL